MAPFKLNTMLGNIRDHRESQARPDHAGRYLASFAWRYNRRETMIPRFVHSAAREPMPYRLLRCQG